MTLQPIKTRFLSGGLFVLSACGTIALFGCVPVIARMLSDNSSVTPHLLQRVLQPSSDLRSLEHPRTIKPDPRS
jgi:hypothetical protein